MPRKIQSSFMTPLIAFLLCMALTLGASFFAYTNSQTENQGRFDRSVSMLIEVMRNRMSIYTNAVIYTRNLFNVKPDLSEAEFHTFIKEMELEKHYPGIQSIGYVERLNKQEAQKLVRSMGMSEKEAGIADNREEYDLVRYVERLYTTNSKVLGLDLSVSPERKKAMDQARDLNMPVATDRVIPMGVTDLNTPFAFLVFVPRYRPGAPVETVEQRRQALIGFLYGGFRATNLFGYITEDPRFRNAHFVVQIFDGKDFDPNRLLYSEGPSETIRVALQKELEFEIANHTWSIRVQAPAEFAIQTLRWSPYFVFALGALLSLGVALALRRSYLLSKRLQEDILVREKTEKLLIEARREADEANRAKSIFLANISHEIRTPLGVMIGFAELAQNQEQKAEREVSLKTIIRNGHELTRIIGDVLDVSKIEAKSLKIEATSFSLPKMLEEIELIWRPQAEAKNLKFIIEISPDIPAHISGDEIRLKQILTNLLSNAVKFTSEGFVRLEVGRELVPTSKDHPQLRFVVRDSGIGIPEANRSKLFRVFSQGDSSITRKFGGSGLGLALSLEIAHAMGGSLALSDQYLEKGSEFVLVVPYETTMQLVTPISIVKPAHSLAGKHILVADDSEDNRQLISLMLRKTEARVDTVNDGSEVLEKLGTAKYDIILMDLQMPVMDGYSALKQIRQQRLKIPVVALTAHALQQEREKALSMGFNAYLTKPIDRSALVNLISELT